MIHKILFVLVFLSTYHLYQIHDEFEEPGARDYANLMIALGAITSCMYAYIYVDEKHEQDQNSYPLKPPKSYIKSSRNLGKANTRLLQHISGHTNEVKNLNDQILSLESQLAALTQQQIDLLTLQNQYNQQVTQLEQENTQLKVEIKTLQKHHQTAINQVEQTLSEKDEVIDQLQQKLQSMAETQAAFATKSKPILTEKPDDTNQQDNRPLDTEQLIPRCPSCGTTELKPRGYYKGNKRYECLNQDCQKKTFTFKG